MGLVIIVEEITAVLLIQRPVLFLWSLAAPVPSHVEVGYVVLAGRRAIPKPAPPSLVERAQLVAAEVSSLVQMALLKLVIARPAPLLLVERAQLVAAEVSSLVQMALVELVIPRPAPSLVALAQLVVAEGPSLAQMALLKLVIAKPVPVLIQLGIVLIHTTVPRPVTVVLSVPPFPITVRPASLLLVGPRFIQSDQLPVWPTLTIRLLILTSTQVNTGSSPRLAILAYRRARSILGVGK